MYKISRFRLRDFTPKGLYARSVLLVVCPLLICLLAITYIFLDSHARHASRKLSQTTASVLAEKIEQIENADSNERHIIFERAAKHLKLDMRVSDEITLPQPAPDIWYSANDEILAHELSAHLDLPYWFDISEKDIVSIKIDLGDNILDITASRNRVFSTRGLEFIAWTILAVTIIMGFTFGFLRNHVRSVLKLSEVAQAIGKGQKVENYRPFGATEVRLAAKAIMEMHTRVTSFNRQRTDMLAGVSHDLRTPITRIRLALATGQEKQLKDDIEQDLVEMSQMLDAYLAFAKNSQTEPKTLVDVMSLLSELAQAADIEFTTNLSPKQSKIECHALNLRRAAGNLIQNALNHADTVVLSAQDRPKSLKIFVDDDGPGISPDEYEAAFQPFNRLDESRNQNTTGTGLGLTIARDIAREHGGDITLSKSPLGGLRAALILPK